MELSKQQIVDCTRDSTYENHGCDGGYLDTSFQYAKQVGLVKDSFYPYTNKVIFSKAFTINKRIVSR